MTVISMELYRACPQTSLRSRWTRFDLDTSLIRVYMYRSNSGFRESNHPMEVYSSSGLRVFLSQRCPLSVACTAHNYPYLRKARKNRRINSELFPKVQADSLSHNFTTLSLSRPALVDLNMSDSEHRVLTSLKLMEIH